MPRIIPAHEKEYLDSVRELFREYAASLPFALDFQDFEEELAALPGKYAPPTGALLLCEDAGKPVGCVALRLHEDGIGEMKRLYLRPGFRGKNHGRLLTKAIIAEARRLGYRRMRLDTVPGMEAAIALYTSLGFQTISPYCHNPLPGALFYEIAL